MPVHDWTRVDAGTFHDFHNGWITHLKEALNGGLLPRGYYAQSEQHALQYVADVLTLQAASAGFSDRPASGGVSVAEAPPRVSQRIVMQPPYTTLRRTLAIRRVTGHRIVALLEILSPGNKIAASKVQDFVAKATDALRHGCHLLVVDLFPPTKFVPHGMHGALWRRWYDEDITLPKNRPLTLASYESHRHGPVEAYLEHLAVGQEMPEMPLFLREDHYVNVPLQPTYDQAFRGMPDVFRAALDRPVNGGRRSRR